MPAPRSNDPPSRAALAASALLLILVAPTAGHGGRPGGPIDLTPSSIPTDQILSGGPPKDGIPALLKPTFVAADDASFIRGEDVVVGLEIDGHARAYPLKILNWHEIVNDELGDLPVAVTYCPLTGSAVVFDRRVNGKPLSFGVSGRLYQSNVLMYDHQSDGLWSQLAGAAVTGKRTGTQLDNIPAQVTTWRRWREDHPDTSVLSPDTDHSRDYDRNPYAGYEASPSVMFPVEQHDDRLPTKARVLGVVLDGQARAYPHDELARAGGSASDELVGRVVELRLDGASASAHASGRLLPAVSVYWFAWAAFHPDTSVWRAPQAAAASGRSSQSAPMRVRVTETRSYWTSLGAVAPIASTVSGTPATAGRGMFVVAGIIENVSTRVVHSVHLRVALLDPTGREIHHEIAYNRSAEALRDLDAGPIRDLGAVKEIRPIQPGATDTYRMIFLGDEIPRFDGVSVTIVAEN